MLSFQDEEIDMLGIAEGHNKGNAEEKVTDSLPRRKLSTLSECSLPRSLLFFSQVKFTLEWAMKAQKGNRGIALLFLYPRR